MEWWMIFGIDPTLFYFIIMVSIGCGSALIYRIKKGKWKPHTYNSEGNVV